MPKKLLLIRHAEAESESTITKDFDRELTGVGISNAYRGGRKLAEKGIQPDKIFSSAAVRAYTTAKLIAEQTNYPEQDIEAEVNLYNPSPRLLLEFINRIDNRYGQVVLVNHNPGITYIAEYLSGGTIGNMSPLGIASLYFDTDDWAAISQRSGTLEWYEEPLTNF